MKKNITPIIGLVLGMALIIWSIMMDSEISNFVHIPSIIITIFGSFCALIISFPPKTLKNLPNSFKALLFTPKRNNKELVLMFSRLTKKARKEGLLALEDDINDMDDEFLVTGLQMVVDGVEPDNIRDILEIKLDAIERRHRIGQSVLLKWSELAPAYGMLGTLIGLIIMLTQLDDPSTIGAGMATALITTFYGSLFANLVFIPIASNLGEQTDEEVYTGQMIIDGILEIQAGSNPRLLEEKLMTYLSPTEQKTLSGFKEEDNYKGEGLI